VSDSIVYTGSSKYSHDGNCPSLLTSGKIYSIYRGNRSKGLGDMSVRHRVNSGYKCGFPIINNHCIIYVIDDRGSVGGYEVNTKDFDYIEVIRNKKIDEILLLFQ
jgi:hypothetical protein